MGYAWLAPTLALPQRGRVRITLTPALSHKWEREYTQAMVRQVVGMHWVVPHPHPAGEGIETGEMNPFPSGFLSFPLWGKAGMGAVHDLKHGQVVWATPGWPPP